jgi:hypothetical protein
LFERVSDTSIASNSVLMANVAEAAVALCLVTEIVLDL